MFNYEALLFLAFFTITIAVGYYIISRFPIGNLKRFQLTISFLGALSAVLIAYSIYVNIKSNRVVEQNRIAYNTISNVYRNFLEPQKELFDMYPEAYFLYASMQPETDLVKLEPKTYDPIKRAQLEVYGSHRMFQAVEDFLSTARWDITGIAVWVTVFLTWMQSPILQAHWKALAPQYGKDTRRTIEHFIEKANFLNELRKKKGRLTTEDYDAISSKFHVDYR